MSTASHNLLTWANLLTAARVLMIVPLTHAVLQQLWLWAAILFTAAAVSDYYDGKVARALNQTSPWGALFDHASDALLVSVGCGALAGLGLINPYLPWLIGAAFIQYMLDSKALAGQELRTSRIGRSNGVAYYVLLGTGIGASLLQVELIVQLLPAAAWLLTASTIVSMLDRGLALVRR